MISFGLRQAIDLDELLLHLGITPKKTMATEVTALCPNPDHHDHRPSWSINSNKLSEKFGMHNCFSCGFRGDIVHLWSVLREVPRKEAIIQIKQIWEEGQEDPFDASLSEREIDLEQNTEVKFTEMPYHFELLEPDSAQWNYLIGREISPEVIQRFRIGYCTKKDPKFPGWIVFPVFFGGDTVGWMAKNPWKKIKPKFSPGFPLSQILFGWDQLDHTQDEIFVVEGKLDALRILSLNYLGPYRMNKTVE